MMSFQEQMQDNGCFGCGPDNPHGLRLKSHCDGEESVCVFHPEPHMSAGPPQFLNGGIIATLVHCHCVCTAVAMAYRVAGRPIGTGPVLWYVTGELNVSYSAPVPIDAPVHLHAQVSERTERKMVVLCEVSSGGSKCAQGRVVAVRVDGWMV